MSAIAGLKYNVLKLLDALQRTLVTHGELVGVLRLLA